MYHFNFSGADPPFNICPTSYDYDAPLTEAGDTTTKYDTIRQLLLQVCDCLLFCHRKVKWIQDIFNE